MNKAKKVYTRVRTIHLSQELDEKLVRFSAKYKVSISETLRNFVEKGLSIESYTEEQDLLRKMIREELQAVQEKQIERLIRLELKSAIASNTALFLLVKSLSDEYGDEASFNNILASAKKQAHVQLKLRLRIISLPVWR